MAALILDPTRLDTLKHSPGEIEELVEAPARGSAVERLCVYAGGYPARVQEALGETYPAVAHLAGEAAFSGLAHRFAEAVPLPSYNLNDAGAALPDFLRDDALAAPFPFLSDLARLEWHVGRAFHAPDEAPFDPAPLAKWGLDEFERAVLRFQPWVALIASEWPIRALWECRETPVEEIDVHLRDRADRVLVRRAGLTVVCESLNTAEADTLAALLAGDTLGSVVADLANCGGDPATVSNWFSHWTARGMIATCTVATDGGSSDLVI